MSETKVNCFNCSNRGVVNGLSEETFCSSCIYQENWRVDWYSPKPQIDNIQRAKLHLSTEAEQLLMQHDVQFHCPTPGHYVIKGLADNKQKITFFPRSCKLQVSKKGTKAEYLKYATIEDCVKHICNLI